MTDPNRSSRVGDKAPWPKGKPRNPPTREWLALRKRLVKLTSQPRATATLDEGERLSQRAIGAYVGVSGKTVCKWLSGQANPSPQYVERMRLWADGKRKI
jgi:DNA-directed RNA polymerase specialized sigma24 family protein